MPETQPPPAHQLEYQQPTGPAGTRGWLGRAVRGWRLAGLLLAMTLIPAIGILQTSLRPQMPDWKAAQCSSNLKDIAYHLMSFSDKHSGHFPDSFAELMLNTDLISEEFCCPASNDTPATGTTQQQAGAFSTGGHLSYIYLGKGLMRDGSANTVLVYEPLSNHKNKGINVLFGDFHVQWLSSADAKKLIAGIVSGKPTHWPVPGGN